MSKTALLSLSLVLILVLFGCKGPSEPTTEEGAEESPFDEDIVEEEIVEEPTEAEPTGKEPVPTEKAPKKAPASPAEPEEKIDFTEIPHGTAKITVDADSSDWEGIAPMPQPFMEKTTGPVKLCWREEGLYGFVTATDDDISPDEERPWQGDSFELFVEKDFRREPFKHYNSFQFLFSPAPDLEGTECYIMSLHPSDEPELEESLQAAWKKTDNGYVLEFMIPADAMDPAKMAPGTRILLHFVISNDGESVEQFFCDKSLDNQWARPKTWGPAILAK